MAPKTGDHLRNRFLNLRNLSNYFEKVRRSTQVRSFCDNRPWAAEQFDSDRLTTSDKLMHCRVIRGR